jgi:hypothetical protein
LDVSDFKAHLVGERLLAEPIGFLDVSLSSIPSHPLIPRVMESELFMLARISII